MRTTKLVSFTLNEQTIKRLNDFSKKHSTNKSALVDKLLNEHMDRVLNLESYAFFQDTLPFQPEHITEEEKENHLKSEALYMYMDSHPKYNGDEDFMNNIYNEDEFQIFFDNLKK